MDMYRRLAAIGIGILVIAAAWSLTSPGTVHERIYEEENSSWQPANQTRLQVYSEKNSDPNVMVELTRYPGEEPTDRQLERSWKLYRDTYRNAREEEWFNMTEGLEDGYFNWAGDSFHYPHENYTRTEETLDPEKPEFLMYYEDPDNSSNTILAGVMFQTSTVEKHGEQIGGPITLWHYHYFNPEACLNYWGPVSNVEVVGPSGQECPPGSQPSRKSYKMLHVWFVDHPRSQFSTDMAISKNLLENGTELLSREEFYSKHR